MIVASFYAPRPEEEKIRWNCNYDSLLILLDKSCKRFGLRHVVISDQIRPEPLETAVFDLPENLMQALIQGQRKFLDSSSEPVLLVGADCLITRDPRKYILGDIGITLGPFSDCEMNTGAIWCNESKKCGEVWQEAEEVLNKTPKRWGDDQRSIYSAILGSDLGISKFRCQDHNWAPDSIKDDAGMPTVVHFRGPRKHFMPGWAERHLGLI